MARKVTQATLTNSSSAIINAIRNTTSLKDYIPVTTDNMEDIRKVGAIILDSPNLRNEFFNTLVNRIGKTVFTGRMYNNPLQNFRKMLDFGETVQEVYVGLIEAVQWDADEDAQTRNVVKKPDIKTAYHVTNFRKHYDVSISNQDAKRAFTEPNGMYELIDRIVRRLYDSAYYDSFLVTKYLIAANLCGGRIGVKATDELNAQNAKSVLVDIKEVTNKFVNLSTKYNMLGVHNSCPIENQVLLLSAKAKAQLDVQALATLFHLEKGDIEQRIITIDDWSDYDGDRVKRLLGSDYYYDFSSDELSFLQNDFYGALIDEEFFQIYDEEFAIDSDYNGINQVLKYALHVWSTYSVSAFVNAVCFCNGGKGTISAITLSSNTLTINTGADGKTTTDVNIDIGNFVSGTTSSSVIYDHTIGYAILTDDLPDSIVMDGSILRIPSGTTFTDGDTISIGIYPVATPTTGGTTFNVTVSVAASGS